MLYRHPDDGTGKPVVFLHGLGATGASFDGLVGALGGEVRSIVFDLHGFGESSDLPPAKSAASNDVMDRHVESVYAELEDIEQPIAIVGHSMGGRIGLLLHEKLSREAIGRAGPLILIDPAIGQPRFRPIIKIFFGNLLGSNEPEDKAMRMLKAVREIPPTDEEARKYATNFRKGRKGFKTNSLAVGAALHGHKEKIANVEAQLLFVWGIKDPLMPVSQGDKFMSLNTGAAIEKIAGCGHIPHEEAPNVVLPLIAKVLL